MCGICYASEGIGHFLFYYDENGNQTTLIAAEGQPTVFALSAKEKAR